MQALQGLSPLAKAFLMRRALSPRLTSYALGLAVSIPFMAQAQAVHFNIPAQPLSSALQAFGHQANIEVLYAPEDIQGLRSKAVNGDLELQQAVATLLGETGLSFNIQGNTLMLSGKSPSSDIELAPTAINADALGNTTEGTGSYTTGATNTATKLNLSLRETPQSVSVMTRQRMDDQGLSTITEVLEQTPGISVQSMGSERFNVYSRGYPISNYQIDGIKSTVEIQTQDVSQSLADMAIYDRVEVLRGASGLMNGAGDPSGTLNMVRKRPTAEFQGHISGSAGSWDKYRGEVDVSGPLNDARTLRGRFVASYQEGKSFIDAYQQEKQVLYGVLEGDLSDTSTLTAGISYQKDDPRGVFGGVGVPLFYSNGKQTNLSRSTNIAERNNTNEVNAYNFFTTYRNQLSDDWALNVSTNHLYSTRDYQWVMGATWSGFPNETTGLGLPLYTQAGESHQRQTGLDARLEGAYQLFDRKHEVVAGFNYADSVTKTDTFSETGGLAGRTIFNIYTWNNKTGTPVFGQKFYDNDTKLRERGYYFATRLNVTDELKFILGSRISDYDRTYSLKYEPLARRIYNKDEKSTESGVFTPYAGITYDLSENHTVYASYATIFMPQSYQDRDGTRLEPREGKNYEVGIKSEFYDRRLNTSLALYYIDQKKLPVVDSGYSVPGSDGLISAYKSEDAKTQGVDVEVTGEVLPDWNLSASYTYGRTEDTKHNQLQTIMPEHMVKLWTAYRLPGILNKMTVGGGINWQSEINFSYSSWMFANPVEAKQEAYATADLMAKYDFSSKLSATLNINNIFDKKYLSSLDQTFNSGFYGDPRNALVSFKYNF
ncbi:TonB-dependent siderophore receptor [Pseudomonas sp. MAFF 302030]|uniref:TonB-dependent siderophore receptor n=1 Tax=Pseudomonas morbosilactucae TaxID=2938197 RepID=A0A9X1Z4F8_9PSED|nr:TonB-dependent siderophore receptor [Pseudomonas morbosilactucae]MCK9802334.1 TonB-dependent siderophore receptor [Pseudomonas morbosilactucae]